MTYQKYNIKIQVQQIVLESRRLVINEQRLCLTLNTKLVVQFHFLTIKYSSIKVAESIFAAWLIKENFYESNLE